MIDQNKNAILGRQESIEPDFREGLHDVFISIRVNVTWTSWKRFPADQTAMCDRCLQSRPAGNARDVTNQPELHSRAGAIYRRITSSGTGGVRTRCDNGRPQSGAAYAD